MFFMNMFPFFRLCRDDIEGIMALKQLHGNKLDCLYLDSTFLSTDYLHFPKQRESINAILNLTDEWLKAHSKNVVVLRPPAAYGYEFLLIELSQYFKVKIHVSNSTFEDYLYIPELDDVISNNPFHCDRIHLCSSNPNQWLLKECPCLPNLDASHICIIRPTAMKWRHLSASDQIHEKLEEVCNVYRVCYSNHSSLEEIQFLIRYLRPKMIKLNVVPKNSRQRSQMFNIVQAAYKGCENFKFEVMEVEEIAPEHNFQKIISSTQRRSMSLAADEISQFTLKKRPRTSTKF